jgi:AcrR family transcriptional regulator
VSARRATGSRRAATQTKRRAYHHGDLRAALIETAIQLIAERGIRDFSLAEASRRLGVAVSAPYAHFADRDELLAAVAVHALELFQSELKPKLAREATAAERLTVIARVYVRFAAKHQPLFQTLFEARFDKRRHPEIEAAERPIEDAFRESVRALPPTGDEAASESLAAALEAIAHGHATLLLDGRFGRGQPAVARAAESAARATLALIDGRERLVPASPPPRRAPRRT